MRQGRLFVAVWRSVWFLLVAGTAVAAPAAYGQDLLAGKTGPELFAQSCAMCHKSPVGLVKTAHALSLNSFLRQHYTTNSTSANAIAAYLRSTEEAARATRERAPQRVERASKSSRPGAEPGTTERPARASVEREPEASQPQKQRERAAAARSADSGKKDEAVQKRAPRGPATAARTPEPAHAPSTERPASPGAAHEPAATSPDAPKETAAWSPALEAQMPPPVEAAEPSGLEADTLARTGEVSAPAPGQRAFSSPIP
jgi:hypothetical protein